MRVYESDGFARILMPWDMAATSEATDHFLDDGEADPLREYEYGRESIWVLSRGLRSN